MIGVLRDVHGLGHHRAVQPFVKQQVGVGRQVLPVGEGARRLAVGPRLLLAVQVTAGAAAAGLGVAAEQRLELHEEVVLRAEMAEVRIAASRLLGHLLAHRRSVVAVEGVAFDERGLDPLAAKDLVEGLRHRGGAGSRGAGDGDDGVADRHGAQASAPARNRPRAPKSGAS